MVHVMRVTGNTIKQMGKAHFGMSMEINMRGNGSTIKHKDTVCIPTPMAQSIKENGKRIFSMDGVWKSGLTEVATMGSMNRAASTEWAHIFGRMVVDILGSGLTIKLKVKASISGLTVEVMKEAGSKIICMGRACTHGKMVEGTKVPTKGTENMGLASTLGLMVAVTRVCGAMVDSMVKENTSVNLMTNRAGVFGLMESGNNGSDLK